MTAPFPPKVLAALKAPGRGDDTDLAAGEGGLVCVQTGEVYPFTGDVPVLFVAEQGSGAGVTSRVKSFYEENPFPSYEGVEEFGNLANKGYSNPFSRDLLDAIGFNKLVLECGCGTGQLSHFLQLNNNQVLGVDMSLGSLQLAVEHKLRNDLRRSAFAQMNLFNLAVKDESMDVVISHGVLHHTHDARRAFAAIVRKVRPGGTVVVGLYNRFARIATWLRARAIGVLGPNVDWVARTRIRDTRKREIWIQDQYFNPHETWHSIDEVLVWFRECGIEYLGCRPPILGTDGEDGGGMFDPTSPGTHYARVVTQLSWLGSVAREGALFDVVGRKPD